MVMFEYTNNIKIKNENVEGLGPWVWITKDDASWECPKYDWIEFQYRKMISEICLNKKIVVQAGGCQGMYPRLLSDMFEQVYTFEPHPINFHALVANCQKDNIIKINGALSDKLGQFILIENEIVNSGCHTLADATGREKIIETGKKYLVQLFTVDSLNLPSLDLLMLDVETYEYNVLQGAVKTINNFNPVIMCEGDIKKVTDFLSTLGYQKVMMIGPDAVYKRS